MNNICNVGMSGFNSYLIIDEKTVLIDTVPEKYQNDFFENIKKHTIKPDYLVFTRTTPDATGCVSKLLLEYPDLKVIASVAGLRNLKEIINAPFNENVAKNNEELNLGNNTLLFLMTPNLSWPDTMAAYLCKQKALFSGNLFCENAEREYFNAASLKTALKSINELSIDLFLPAYGEFVKQEEIPEQGSALGIIYSSSGGNTEEMAYVIKNAAIEAGKKAIVCRADRVTAELFLECDSFAFGTPTVNHNADISVISAISGMNVVRNTGKPAFVFGSYGWSGEGVEIAAGLLKNLKLKVYKKPFKSIFKLSDEVKTELYDEALKFIGEIKNA